MKFEPMLGCNDKIDIREDITYPIIASIKKDGIRCGINSERICSRSLKDIPNVQINTLLKPLTKYADDNGCIIEGELYIHGLPFNEISMLVNTTDYNTRSHVDKIRKLITNKELTKPYNYYLSLPKEFEFYCFNILTDSNEPYINRIKRIPKLCETHNFVTNLEWLQVNNYNELLNYYEYSLKLGYEGLCLFDKYGSYKFGRSTKKEQLFLKLKSNSKFIGDIIGITTRKINLNESFKNELGFMVKSNTVDMKQETDIAAAFVVKCNGNTFNVTINGSVEYRKEVYANVEKYIGRKVSFEGMLYGAKSAPRHCVNPELL